LLNFQPFRPVNQGVLQISFLQIGLAQEQIGARVLVAVNFQGFLPDGDGFGTGDGELICSAIVPAGYSANNTDCNDADAVQKPGQIWYTDADGDGYATGVSVTQCLRPTNGKIAAELTATSGDCNDNNAAVNPAATEICDGIDNNCNGQIDEGVKTSYYQDSDGDGYGNPSVSVQACSAPVGYMTDKTDCDDSRASIHPNAPELCDGLDNNCNGQVDEGMTSTYYRDADGDLRPGHHYLFGTHCPRHTADSLAACSVISSRVRSACRSLASLMGMVKSLAPRASNPCRRSTNR